MCDTKILLKNNRLWAEQHQAKNPELFKRLAKVHSPKYLWIGCSDSRVAVDTIFNLDPGKMFVHRNVGNVICPTDTNINAVVTYAIKFLKIQHIIVAGHYDCGAVKATLSGIDDKRMNAWLKYIAKVANDNTNILKNLKGIHKINALCELNTKAQARNLAAFSAISQAWEQGQNVSIYSWIYNIKNGLLSDLEYTIKSPADI